VERVYVDQFISDRFVEALTRRLAKVRVGITPRSTYGPMTVASQADIVRAHVADAVASGAGTPLGGLDRIDGREVSPILLVNADERGRAIQEETFGPVVTIRTVANIDEAVRLANGTTFGLGAAVFAKRDGDRIAAALRCGMVSINSVLAFTSIPALPFGGVGDSGYGRIHGAEGLREFSRTKAIARKLVDPPGLNGMRLDRPAITMHILRAFTAVRFRFGKRSVK
jgi:aldehyde dehydrogenase (NAD+)